MKTQTIVDNDNTEMTRMMAVMTTVKMTRMMARLMMAVIMWVMDDTNRMLCQRRDDANVDEHEKMRAS